MTWPLPFIFHLLLFPSSLGTCGHNPRYDPVRLLAEQNTKYIAEFIDNSKDVDNLYRTDVVTAAKTSKRGRPSNVFTQLPQNLPSSVFFSLLLVPMDVQCDASLFSIISKVPYQRGRRRPDKSPDPRFFFLGVGYEAGHPQNILKTRQMQNYLRSRISTQMLKKEFGGKKPKLCLTLQKTTRETANNKVKILIFMFNFILNKDNLQKRSVHQVSTSGNQECKTSSNTLEMLSRMYDTRPDIYSFTRDTIIGYESDRFIGIQVHRDSAKRRGLTIVTSKESEDANACDIKRDIVAYTGPVVFTVGQTVATIIIEIKQDDVPEETETFDMYIGNIHKRVKRGTKRRGQQKKGQKRATVEIEDRPKIKYPTTENKAEEIMLYIKQNKAKKDWKSNEIYRMLQAEHNKLKQKGYIFLGWRGIKPTDHQKNPKPHKENVIDYLQHREKWKNGKFLNSFYKRGNHGWQGMYLATFVGTCYGYVEQDNDKRIANPETYLPWIFRVYLKASDIQKIDNIQMWQEGDSSTISPDPYELTPNKEDEYIYYGLESSDRTDFRGFEMVLSPSVAQKARFLLSTFTAKGYNIVDKTNVFEGSRGNVDERIEYLKKNKGEPYETTYGSDRGPKQNLLHAENKFKS